MPHELAMMDHKAPMMPHEMAKTALPETTYAHQDYGMQHMYGYQQPHYGYQQTYGYQQRPVSYEPYTASPPVYMHHPYGYSQISHNAHYGTTEEEESSSEGSEEKEMKPMKKNLEEMLKMDEEEKMKMMMKKEEEMISNKVEKEEKKMEMMKAFHIEEKGQDENEDVDMYAPKCAHNSTRTWCDEEDDYPEDYIRQAIEYHFHKFLNLYADIEDLDTPSSVDRASTLEEETYLCSSKTSYIQPIYAQNTEGKWRMVVNNIELHYKMITQSARVEECLAPNEDCPLVPYCYSSKCLQKYIYHRFLVFTEEDPYFPFAVENFRLPLACSCKLEEYELDH